MAGRGAQTAHSRIRRSGGEFPTGTDHFDFNLVGQEGEQFEGYNSVNDPTDFNPRYLVRGSLNVFKKISGNIASRAGRKLYDATSDTTLAGIISGFIWNTSLAVSYPLRVANGNLQVESNVTGSRVWYSLLTGLTTTPATTQQRFVFDTYWDTTDKKDKLLMVNGQATIYDWSGGFALFSSATATVITLIGAATAAAQGFASAGTVTINGNDYAYTGLSGSTLTGVTPSAAAEAVNSVVVQKINSTLNTATTSGPSATFKDDFIRVVGNQMYLGSYTSRNVFMSKNTSFKDFSNSATRLPGEGQTITLDENAKGIGVKSGQAYIFGGTSALFNISFAQLLVGSSIAEQVITNKVELGHLVSALAHEFIDISSDNLIYLDQSNQLRSFGNFKELFSVKAAMLSLPVQEELRQEDFTNGQLRVISDKQGDIVYINAPRSGKTYVYQERSSLDDNGILKAERIWQPPQTWGFSRVDVTGTSTVGFSTANPQMYTIWDTGQWQDDAPGTALGIPYNAIALFAYRNSGRRALKVVFDRVYYEGYAPAGANVFGAIYFDYQGSTQILQTVINTPQDPFPQVYSGTAPPSLGGASLGDNPLGDALNALPDDQQLLPKFRAIIGFSEIDCFEYALMIYSNDIGARWEIICLGANDRLSINLPIEATK